MFVSGDAEGPWPSGKLQLFELERSLLHSGCMLGLQQMQWRGGGGITTPAAFSMQSTLLRRGVAGVVVPPVLSFFLPWNDCANAAQEMQGGPCRPSTVYYSSYE